MENNELIEKNEPIIGNAENGSKEESSNNEDKTLEEPKKSILDSDPKNGLNDILKRMQAPKQEFTETIEKTKPVEKSGDKIEDKKNIVKKDDDKLKISSSIEPSKKNKLQAKAIVKTTDYFTSNASMLISGDEKRSKYKQDEEEEEALIDAWSLYLEESGGNIPPIYTVVILTMVIVGSKIFLAFREKKKKQRIQQELQYQNEVKEEGITETENITVGEFKVITGAPAEKTCQNCGKGLNENQKKFCSNICKNRYLTDKRVAKRENEKAK